MLAMASPAHVSPQANGSARIQAIRRFNRFYTRQIGVLQEGLLNSPYSLTEVRVLYELAHHEGVTASTLCHELSLDSGYLSRVLAKFEKCGWIRRRASPTDARQSLLALTGKGRAGFAPLDERSNGQVQEMLERISPAAQDELVRAMQTVERILAPVQEARQPYLLRAHQPGDMGWVVYRHGVLYAQEYHYDERFEALVAEIVAEFVQKFDAKRERCWIAERDGERLGSVFLVRQSATVSKLRLLLVEPSARGLGIGKRLVQECVRFAQQVGYKKMILWTQSELKAARGIYQQAGFRLVKQEPHESWSRTNLVAETWELKL
jgi:DNA-binding MarR family transcriptional regulator/N-acetylglutamate synthase-like GNAT family acetyltransferase